jgi:hypothetical protein
MRKFLLAYTMLAALGSPAMADPFVSGSEPGWGKNMSTKQHRMAGFDDVHTALKNNHKPAPVVGGVPGYAFKLLTIRHDHGHDGGGEFSGGGGANGNSGGVNISIGGGYGGGSTNNNEDTNKKGPPPFSISQIISKPFGVFKTLQECDAARAIKIAELDDNGLRTMHSVVTGKTSARDIGRGVSERQDVTFITFCEPGEYLPGTPSPHIAEPPIGPQRLGETTGAATSPAQTTTLEVPPGFVAHYTAPRPFARVIPGTSDVVEILSTSERGLVFMIRPDNARPTNILLVNDLGEVVANLRVTIPGQFNTEIQRGPDGTQMYNKDNPDYVAPKEKK